VLCGVGIAIPIELNFVQLRTFSFQLEPFPDTSSMSMDTNGTTDLMTREDIKHPSPELKPLDKSFPPFPDPKTSPKEFLVRLRSIAIDDLVTAFEHLKASPVRVVSTQLYDESAVGAWTDRMDMLIVSLT